MPSSSACESGKSFAIASSGTVARMPATTSSPCAFARKSPYGRFSPVAGSRVNATPVPESSPLLPNTMVCTFTAVPRSSGIFSSRR